MRTPIEGDPHLVIIENGTRIVDHIAPDGMKKHAIIEIGTVTLPSSIVPDNMNIPIVLSDQRGTTHITDAILETLAGPCLIMHPVDPVELLEDEKPAIMIKGICELIVVRVPAAFVLPPAEVDLRRN
jgi:hypothetical protein